MLKECKAYLRQLQGIRLHYGKIYYRCCMERVISLSRGARAGGQRTLLRDEQALG